MSVLVKICGLKTPETLEAAVEAGADLLGFVFFPPSPRHVSLDNANSLRAQVRGRALKTALTVDADDPTLDNIVAALAPDLLQLHGHETPARVEQVRARFGLPVMKAVALSDAGDLKAVNVYAAVADRLLFDARPPRDATRPGGLGRTFDWSLLREFRSPKPFLLSGGLDAENVAAAVSIASPDGVDVSSGVERVIGEKDPDKIRAFVRAARNATPAGITPAAMVLLSNLRDCAEGNA